MLKQPCTAIRGAHAENSLGRPVIQDVVNLAVDLVLHTFEILVHSLQAGVRVGATRGIHGAVNMSATEVSRSWAAFMQRSGASCVTVSSEARAARLCAVSATMLITSLASLCSSSRNIWSGHPPANDRSVTTKEKTRSAITVCCCQTSNISDSRLITPKRRLGPGNLAASLLSGPRTMTVGIGR